MNDSAESSPIMYPHVVFDASGAPIRIERILKGLKCEACPYSVDLGQLVKTENSYTLICPHCSDVTSQPASKVNEVVQAYEQAEKAHTAAKIAEREAFKRAAAEDDARLAVTPVATKKKAAKKKAAKKAAKKKATRRKRA